MYYFTNHVVYLLLKRSNFGYHVYNAAKNTIVVKRDKLLKIAAVENRLKRTDNESINLIGKGNALYSVSAKNIGAILMS